MLEEFFAPRAVAVVGASREPGKVGHDVLRNLQKYGFRGAIYPINPKAEEILGLRCYASIGEVPGPVDLAVIVVPARFVPAVVDDCGRKGVRGLIIISAGFKEVGRDGAELERQVVEIARRHSMRIIGPNCLGLINTHARLNASFAAGAPAEGNVAFISQSGAFGTAILDWALHERRGFSKFVSVGNKADVDESDLLKAIGQDNETEVILIYLEGLNDGRKFVEVARAVTRRRPVVVLKAGGTAAGARAASSHTGALAGSEAAYEAAFRQTGILRARTVEELFDYASAFSLQGRMAGHRVAIVTNAGGPGIIATDAVERSALTMATLARETVERLRPALPPAANLYNPVDVIGDAGPDRYDAALQAVAADPGVDGIIVIVTPQSTTKVEETAAVVGRAAAATDKPVLACFMGGERISAGLRVLADGGVPNYPFPERAVAALDAMSRYSAYTLRPESQVESFPVDREQVAAVLSRARAAGKFELAEADARAIIAAYGFRTPASILASTPDAAVQAAEQIGYPVVLKIASPDILHKSDIGGVRVWLSDPQSVRQAFGEIVEGARRRLPLARLEGCLVQPMIMGGKEVILGMNRDPQFGPMLMFGLGGIYVEVLRDVAFRLAPLTPADAMSMIREIRSLPLLRGTRGEKPSDLSAIVEGLLRLSQLAMDFPEIVELDLNPLVVYPVGEGAVALDCRLSLAADPKEART